MRYTYLFNSYFWRNCQKLDALMEPMQDGAVIAIPLKDEGKRLLANKLVALGYAETHSEYKGVGTLALSLQGRNFYANGGFQKRLRQEAFLFIWDSFLILISSGAISYFIKAIAWIASFIV